MSLEHRLYQTDRIGWVFFLMFKYFFRQERFKPVLEAMKAATTPEEQAAARQALDDHREGRL